MKLLLDTHALIWWLAGDERLGHAARAAIADEGVDVLVSAASAWEVATKVRLGKLDGAALLARDFEAIVTGQGFGELAVSIRHARLAGSLGGDHKDPFDRMLIAQALLEELTLVSNEEPFDAHGVLRLW